MEFAKRFIDDSEEIQPVERHGKDVEVHAYNREYLAKKIMDFNASDHKSCGIICQNWQEAAKIEAAFPENQLVRFEKDTKKIAEGIILTTLQFAKGLEFDQVILPDIRSRQLQEKSNCLYTSCSRALHELTLLVKD